MNVFLLTVCIASAAVNVFACLTIAKLRRSLSFCRRHLAAISRESRARADLDRLAGSTLGGTR